MMAPIFELLSANAPVTAILGTSPTRVFPAGQIPQKQPYPAVTWQVVGGSPQNVFGTAPVDHQRVQIDCWADTYLACNDLGEKVRAALENSGWCVSFNGHDYDKEAKVYRCSFDFSFWTDRN